MSVDRVVVDTNVFISAVLSELGPPFRVVEWAMAETVDLLLCEAALEELETRLSRPKFDKYLPPHWF